MVTPEKTLRQLDAVETRALADTVCLEHAMRLVVRGSLGAILMCRCNGGFLDIESAADHVHKALERKAVGLDCVLHSEWSGLRPARHDAPAGVITGGPIRDSDVPVFEPLPLHPAEAERLIADLVSLLKADEYPVAVGSEVLKRAEAFLDGSKMPPLEPLVIKHPPLEVDENDRPGALVSLSIPEIKRIRQLAEIDAEARDPDQDPQLYVASHDVAIKMREAFSKVATKEARNALRDAHYNVCNSYDPGAEDSVYADALRLLNEALELRWDEA